MTQLSMSTSCGCQQLTARNHQGCCSYGALLTGVPAAAVSPAALAAAACPLLPCLLQGLRNLDATPRLNLASFVTT